MKSQKSEVRGQKSEVLRSFTLIELLTVVAIIALLISILVPAVQRAQRRAKEVAIQAQLHGITTGLEMFKGDFGYYPSSLPQDADGVDPLPDANDNTRGNVVAADIVQGAHRLAFAMMGRDKLGCPTKSGESGSGHSLPDNSSDTGPDSLTGWYYSSNTNGSFDGTWIGPAGGNWGDPDYKTARKGPYVNPQGVTMVEDKRVDQNGYAWLLCDKFNKKKDPIANSAAASVYINYSPILYFAANQRGSQIGNTTDESKNIYYWEDNAQIMGSNFKDLNEDGSIDQADFWAFIEDKSAKIGNFSRPHNPDSYILMSRGWDNTFGTDDDIVNWSE